MRSIDISGNGNRLRQLVVESRVNLDWMQTTAGMIGSATVILGAIAAIGRGIYKIGRRVHGNAVWIKQIHDELSPNGGLSVRDTIHRIEAFQIAGLELTGKAFYRAGPDGAWTMSSYRLATLIGVGADRLIGHGWISMIDQDDRDRIRSEWESSIDDRREFYGRFGMIGPQGKRINVVAHAIPVTHPVSRVGLGAIGWIDSIEPAEPSVRICEHLSGS
jgi:PAS domain-containing protein